MQRADKRKYHYIYKITRDDGRFYIGMHSTDLLDDGYFGSGKLITRSIRKHGKERHSKEILEFCHSRNDLKTREKFLITDEMRLDTKCMNIAPGGGGGFINEEHRKKWVGAGRLTSPEKLLKIKETIAKRKLEVPGYAEALAMKLSRAAKGRQTFLNRKHAEETKAKIGAKNSKHQTGEGNSQFGTCWVTNGVKPVKIKKEQLDEYLAKGFIRGRNNGRTSELES